MPHRYLKLISSELDMSALPIYGKLSEEAGIDSETNNRNTARDRRTVTPRDTFSPDSTGSRKLNMATTLVRMHGNRTVII